MEARHRKNLKSGNEERLIFLNGMWLKRSDVRQTKRPFKNIIKSIGTVNMRCHTWFLLDILIQCNSRSEWFRLKSDMTVQHSHLQRQWNQHCTPILVEPLYSWAGCLTYRVGFIVASLVLEVGSGEGWDFFPFCTVFKDRLDVQQDSLQDWWNPVEIFPPIAQSRQQFHQ